MDNEFLRVDSGMYKLGSHGLVFRWSNFNSEWLHSSMTVEEFNELKEKENAARESKQKSS